MNHNLEFIEKCIKETKQSIEHWKEQLKRYPKEEVLTRCLNTREIELLIFQNVKTELIMWEVAKKVLNHFDIELIECLLIGLCASSEISKDEMQNFKKVLEEKDNE